MTTQKMVEWEISLAAPDAFVIISAPEDTKDDQLLALACDELTRKTYIWSKKRTNPPNSVLGGEDTNLNGNKPL